MKERGIIFRGDMVQEILAGRKTQTRRLVKHLGRSSPYGEPGDRLWVRETFRHYANESKGISPVRAAIKYQADGETLLRGSWPDFESAIKRQWWNTGVAPWTSPRFMPRWASRIDLEITAVRVERLKEISPEDAWAEGCRSYGPSGEPDDPRPDFRELWDSINAKKAPFVTNPWVWVISFERRTWDPPTREEMREACLNLAKSMDIADPPGSEAHRQQILGHFVKEE